MFQSYISCGSPSHIWYSTSHNKNGDIESVRPAWTIMRVGSERNDLLAKFSLAVMLGRWLARSPGISCNNCTRLFKCIDTQSCLVAKIIHISSTLQDSERENVPVQMDWTWLKFRFKWFIWQKKIMILTRVPGNISMLSTTNPFVSLLQIQIFGQWDAGCKVQFAWLLQTFLWV